MKFFCKFFLNKQVFKKAKDFVYNVILVFCKVLLLVSALKSELVKFPLSRRWKINEPLT